MGSIDAGMIKKIFAVFIVFYFFKLGLCYGLDWKSLHNEAAAIFTPEACESVKKDKFSLEYIYLRGLTYLNVHSDRKAKDEFMKMLTIAPETVEAQWGIAEVLRREYEFGNSERMLLKIIGQSPEFWPAYISLSYLYYNKRDFKKTINLAVTVTRQGKRNVDVSNYTISFLLRAAANGMRAYHGGPMAKVMYGLGVLPTLRKAQRLQPESPAVLFGLGSFYFLSPSIAGGNRQKALKYFKRTIEIDPFFTDAYVRLAQYYRLTGDEEQYRAYLGKATHIDSKNILLNDFTGGECYFGCVGLEDDEK